MPVIIIIEWPLLHFDAAIVTAITALRRLVVCLRSSQVIAVEVTGWLALK